MFPYGVISSYLSCANYAYRQWDNAFGAPSSSISANATMTAQQSPTNASFKSQNRPVYAIGDGNTDTTTKRVDDLLRKWTFLDKGFSAL